MPKIIVTSYLDSDLDGTACSLAYTELLNHGGVEAQTAFFGTPSEEAHWVAHKLGMNLPGPVELKDAEIILTDASDRNSLEIKNLNLDQVIEIIDHRQAHEAEVFRKAKIQIELVGSCATLITERFKKAGVIPSRNSAIFLSAAIASNTLNFLSRNKTERDTRAWEWLKSIAQLPEDFVLEMFRAKSDLSGNKLSARLENEYARVEYAGQVILFCQIEMIGAEDLARDRLPEIFIDIRQVARRISAKYYLCSLVELNPKNASNIFITDQTETQKILSEILDVKFTPDGTAVRSGLIMRKEVLPLMKKYLENGLN